MAQGTGRAAREEMLASVGGLRIFVRSWQPDGESRAVIVICHGVNSHGGQYTWAAEQLTIAGFSVYALDLRGRGKSEGDRFYVDDVSEYAGDVATVVRVAKSRAPGLPVILLGHSAGGVTSCVYTLDHQAELAGLICESFAFQVPAPGAVLTAIKGLSRIAPRLPVLTLKNRDFTRDPQALRALNDDPLIANEKQPAKTVAALVRADERLAREFSRIVLPVLILHGTSDRATRPSGSRRFYEAAGSKDKTLKLYEGHFHDLLNDIGKEQVMADIMDWLDAHVPARARRAGAGSPL
jgi:alpha-beta hydrolase superfamily lysophospholipase